MAIWNWIRRFAAEARGGHVAIILSIALVPVAVLTGSAVDFNQAMHARARLAEALDAAALAAGSSPNLTIEQRVRLAEDYIAANYPAHEIGQVRDLAIQIDERTGMVTVSARSQVRTAMLGIIGVDTLDVHWESEVRQAQGTLELVMVLDNTGSMAGAPISDLRNAALTLTDILFTNANDIDKLRIGLVPFAATVNVGTQNTRAWWLDPDGRSPVHGQWQQGDDGGRTVETCGWVNTGPGRGRGQQEWVCETETIAGSASRTHWQLFDTLRYTSWGGCVEQRPIPYDIDATPADPSRPETLFVPYFAPDEPDVGSYSNNYLSDGAVLTTLQDALGTLGVQDLLYVLADTVKYTNATPSTSGGRGPNRGCTTAPITPMTNNRTTIDNAIQAMGANGYTNIPAGIGWGVRVLAPEAPYTEGAAWDDRDVVKAMVILTDGDNVMSGHGGAMRSLYEAYGYSVHGRLGTTSSSGSTLASHLNQRTVAACEYARSRGIRVYTIVFGNNVNAATQTMMRNCASHPSLYFLSPSAAELRDSFSVIAGDLSNLRLSR